MAFPSRILRGGLVLAALLWVASPAHLFAYEAGSAKTVEDEAKGDRVVVRVNGDPITEAQVATELELHMPSVTGHGELSPERLETRQREVVRDMVIRRLIRHEAKAAGLTATEAEMAEESAALIKRFGGEARYRATLASRGMDPDTVRQGLEEHVLGRKMLARIEAQVEEPTDKVLRAYYDANREKFKIPARATVRYLLAGVDPTASTAEWEAAKARLIEIRERVLGGTPFMKETGDLPPDGPVKLLEEVRIHQGQSGVEVLNDAAFSTQAGDMSEPVRTLYGYVLVYVVERSDPGQLEFEELNRDLFAREWLAGRRAEIRNAWMAGILEKAEVEFIE
ncbi:MAG: peptidyl-prolyl cis-trans isomerase [Leptospirillia bacterium]